ncbi:MAG: cytochrome b/b6 domain-containing protein [Bauldia sp.]|nr:cytochrome b/b6 domain-containing protein [Bauldia sp.]
MSDRAGKLTPRSYSLAQILLHWVIAALVVWQLVFGESMGEVERQGAAADASTVFLADTHIWAGFAILVLVLLRIVLRLAQGAPPPVDSSPALALLAKLAHAAFYVLLVLVPLTGIGAYYLDLPVGGLHELGKPLFIVLIALHVAAALWHQFVRHDGTLRRMLVPG